MATRAQLAQQKSAFLDAFRKSGNVTAAARAAGVARRTPYGWCEHDERFLLEYRQAELEATDVLVAAAWQRAVNGVKQEHRTYSTSGKLIDTQVETKYSDNLLMFLIKKRDPSYRESYDLNHRHSGPDGGPIRTDSRHEVRTIDYDAFADAFRGAASLPAGRGDDPQEPVDTA